ncbi:MAG: EF-hand domain-containing protein [Rhodobacteraceae bacterium]|nr:EF-hand domain-containing protein [Paracoccaceae bacterium]
MKTAGFIAIVLATAGLVAAGAAQAQPGGPGKFGPKLSFEELDTDGNGELSKAELMAQREAHFKKADTNGDGALSLEEAKAQGSKMGAERAAKMFERMDENADQKISLDELPKPRKAGKMFNRMDSDGNGSISAEEFADAKAHMKRHGGKHGMKSWRGKGCQDEG